jgi:hypothetical protein
LALFSGPPVPFGEMANAAAPYRDPFAIKAQWHSFT